MRGGPEHLLGWLEDQLGVTGAGGSRELHRTDRVRQYMEALDRVEGRSFRQSYEADPWATAAELLNRRDQLLVAGWNPREEPTAGLPGLVRDLGRAEEHFEAPGRPDRLQLVHSRLQDPGTGLPTHELILRESPDLWPACWRAVLQELDFRVADPPDPAAETGTSLHALQHRLLGEADGTVELDRSVQWVGAASVHAAAQAIAAAIGGSHTANDRVAIYCPDPGSGVRLEEAFQRLGLPALGAGRDVRAHPTLQLLPLLLELCWEPVDPQVLMDFLSLPVNPIPGPARRKLANALAEMPGMESRSWQRAWSELREEDPELDERLNRWLRHERVPPGEELPDSVVSDRCGALARWARGYAEKLSGEDDQATLKAALQTVAAQAASLSAVVEATDVPLTEPQILRMLEDVRASGAIHTPRSPEVGAPFLVSDLADVPPWTDHLIWFGVGLEPDRRPGWMKSELETLRESGLEIDEGRTELSARRKAERRALQRVSSTILAVQLPTDAERRDHPLWTEVLTALGDDAAETPDPIQLQRAITEELPLGPWSLDRREASVRVPESPPTEWAVPNELLSETERSSATELQHRLACPLRWVLRRVARIKPSPSAQMPDDFTLRGRFAHQILNDVLGGGGDVPAPEEVVNAVRDRFDERVTLDAAPLAEPSKMAERHELRDELADAAGRLADVLRRGGYRVVRGEAPIEAEYEGRPLGGRIDLVVTGPRGEGIVDFKYGGRNRYRELLEEGRAIQLAVYAKARAQQNGDDDPLDQVGYLVIHPRLLYTPEGSPLLGALAGAMVEDAPSIGDVWERFQEALDRSQGWLGGDDPVPVRPRQDPDQWPAGAEMAIETDGSDDRSDLRPCKYCDYKLLCGVREAS